MNAARFPIYLKLSNEKAWYIIHSEAEMEEIQVVGKKFLRHHILAKILPERLLIKDMLENKDKQWKLISKKEFDDFLRINNIPVAER